MDHQKICLIYCVNNEDLFEESMTHVGALIIPDGYTLERVVIRNASSITEGYNMAMRETDAKYKIYIHQDVNVLNQNFLPEMLFLFHRYHGLGMMGVAGRQAVAAKRYLVGCPRGNTEKFTAMGQFWPLTRSSMILKMSSPSMA